MLIKINNKLITRRRLIRGLSNGAMVTIGLPYLEYFLNAHGTAFADGSPFKPKFGIFFWGNGMDPSAWAPSQTGANWQSTVCLDPLVNAGLKSDISIVSGLTIESGGERGHHAGAARMLSGYPFTEQPAGGANYSSTFSTQSIDQLIADKLNSTSRLKSLEIGICPEVTGSEGSTLAYLSHNGPNNYNPADYSESSVFNKIFRNFSLAGGSSIKAADADPQVSRLIADVILADANDLKKKLSATDRQRLDQHLEHLFTLEQEVSSGNGSGGDSGGADMGSDLTACHKPNNPGNANTTDYAKKSSSMAKILAMALACDQTQVFTIHFSGSVGGTVIPGTTSSSFHDISHNEGASKPNIRKGTVFIMDQLAKFLKEMKSIDTGSGTLLDQVGLIATSDVSDGQAHSGNNMPIVIGGSCNGKLKTGLHINGGAQHTNKLLLSMIRAMGVNQSSLGVDGRGKQSQGLSEIES